MSRKYIPVEIARNAARASGKLYWRVHHKDTKAEVKRFALAEDAFEFQNGLNAETEGRPYRTGFDPVA